MEDNFSVDYECSLEKSERPFGMPNFLLTNAGPSTLNPRVLHAMSQPLVFMAGNLHQASSIICMCIVYLNTSMTINIQNINSIINCILFRAMF